MIDQDDEILLVMRKFFFVDPLLTSYLVKGETWRVSAVELRIPRVYLCTDSEYCISVVMV